MMRSGKVRVWVNPVLGAILLALVLAYLGKIGVIRARWISSNKNLLDALTDVVNILAIVFAAVFSYFRFFRGRVLTERVELTLDVSAITGPSGVAVQLVTLSIHNIGTVPIWNPVVSGIAAVRHADGSRTTRTIDGWDEGLTQRGGRARAGVAVIDSGETTSYSVEVVLESSIWALTYAVSVASKRNEWSTARIVAGPHAELDERARSAGRRAGARGVGRGSHSRRN